MEQQQIMKPNIKINQSNINQDAECYVIAEIGCNHQGDIEKAKSIITKAKQAGANAVKLQKRNNNELFTQSMYDMPYINENSFGKTYGEHREFLELNKSEYIELQQHAKDLDITLFATPFDFQSVDFLADLNMPAYKIASGDITNIPLIKYVANLGKPLLVSTGGATLTDVKRAYDTIMPINPNLCILQCTSSYPAEPEDMNLNVIKTYQDNFKDIIIGLSDHQNGIAMALVGYVLGARVIEKHFTINRGWKGTDQAFSLEYAGLEKLVRDLQRAKSAMGDGIKSLTEKEKNPIFKLGKKIVAAKTIEAGSIITRNDIAIKSPGDGLAPYNLNYIIGKNATKTFIKDEDIDLIHIK